MNIVASILRSAYKLSGAKKAFALPEDALRKEIEKQNRHRGVFTPTDRKAYYETITVNDIMKKSKKVYRELVEKADDIGDDNPMAYNELFALAFVAPYVASEKKIPPTAVQEMMRRSLYHIKWYFAKTDMNTDKGKAENKKSVVKYAKWYTPEKEAKYPTSFKVDFVGQPYEGACYYRITRCPICIYTEKLGVSELMPLFCELDEVMITLQHGVLHRKQTLANGGEYCDYYITGNRE